MKKPHNKRNQMAICFVAFVVRSCGVPITVRLLTLSSAPRISSILLRFFGNLFSRLKSIACWRPIHLGVMVLHFFSTIVLLGFSSWALADTVTDSFTSDVHKGSTGGMVWNFSLGEIHPPLQVAGWDNGGGATTTAIDVGDGSDGAFQLSRYAIFDTDGDVSSGIIEIDTDAHPNLQFTVFDLDSGYTIRPVGNSPLIIRVLTTVQIDGTIDCSGQNGGNAIADINATRVGGTGFCHGANGGISVPAAVFPGVTHQGSSGGAGTTGGAGGPVLTFGGQGGGGGGAFIKSVLGGSTKPDPTSGRDVFGVVGNGGAVGIITVDDGFTVVPAGAGSGGGGGSAYNDPGDVANHSSGSAGGAGGGTIRIFAVGNITVGGTGSVLANGGNGGTVVTGKGGSGGGGGGGSIQIFSGGVISIDGPITATAGVAGSTSGGSGGTGAWGRTWVLEKNGFASLGSVTENPETQLNVPGVIEFESGVTYTVTSKAIDLGNTVPTPTTLPLNIANSVNNTVLVYELAFSDSDDLASLSGFALSATYLNLPQKRYARFRIQIDNTSSTLPAAISDLSFLFDGLETSSFDFATGCGSLTTIGVSSGRGLSTSSKLRIGNLKWASGIFYFILLFFPLSIWIYLRARCAYQRQPA